MKQFSPLGNRTVCSISINDSYQGFSLFLTLSYWSLEAHWGFLYLENNSVLRISIVFSKPDDWQPGWKLNQSISTRKYFGENPSTLCKPEEVSDKSLYRFSHFPFELPLHREELYATPLLLIIKQKFEVYLNFSFSSVRQRGKKKKYLKHSAMKKQLSLTMWCSKTACSSMTAIRQTAVVSWGSDTGISSLWAL